MAIHGSSMKQLFLIFGVFLSSYVLGLTTGISDEDKISLKIFLRVLTENSEAGYVLFNKKPVCIHGYDFKDPFRVKSENYKEASALKAGAKIWKKIKNENSNICIHISQNEDPQIPGIAHVLVINKPLFHQVVNQNLLLFQYVLGPKTTSQGILNALIIEDQPFHALLKYDKVLIGIILGFGAHNSLFGSRMECIHESLEHNSPPFRPSSLTRRDFDHEYFPFSPSFGFKTVQDEIEHYSKILVISSSDLQEKNPNFIFGAFEDATNNQKFIQELEETQQKIQQLLLSKDAEVQILEKILNITLNPHFFDISLPHPIQMRTNYSTLNEVVAKGLWEFLQQESHEYLSYFFDGLEKCDIKNLKVDGEAYFSNYLQDFFEARENLTAANSFFQSLENNKEMECIEPFKLYYKTLGKKTSYEKKCKGSFVTLTYDIVSPLNQRLSQGTHQSINLKNTIPGFAFGIQGMGIGETREIFIHPSLAYGFDTYFLDKCIYLKAIVTLEETHNEQPLPEMSSIDLDFILDNEVLRSRETNYKNALLVKAAMISSHLKKCKEINLLELKKHLSEIYSHPDRFTATTDSEQDLINRVHWNIYWAPLLNQL